MCLKSLGGVLLGQMAETQGKSHMKDEGKEERELNQALRSARSHQRLKQLNLQAVGRGVWVSAMSRWPWQTRAGRRLSIRHVLFCLSSTGKTRL